MNARPLKFRGFTLIELITVIVLVGILAAVVTPIIGSQFTAYTDSSRRATLVQEAQSIMQRLEQDLSQAVPNSIDETTDNRLGLLRLSSASLSDAGRALGAGRYSNEFNPSVANSDVTGFGCLPTAAGQHVVLFPGTARSALEAYDRNNPPNSGPVTPRLTNPITSDCANGTFTIDLGDDHTFDPDGDGSLFNRLYLSSGRVDYQCDQNQMTRTQDFAPTGERLVSSDISACQFTFITGTTFAPPSLLVDITVARAGEAVRLVRLFQLVNAP